MALGRRPMEAKLAARPFFCPPHIMCGLGTASQSGMLLQEMGVRSGRVLVVSDVGVAELGLTERVRAGLADAGFAPVVFSDIRGEPTMEDAETAVTAARREGPVAVVGVGGGSALDLAKLAAVGLTNAGSIAEYFEGRPFQGPPPPLVLIPTTAGTGAEGSRSAVVIRGGRKVFVGHHYLTPRGAILDPELTRTLPPHLTAWTGMDAVSHCIEALMSTSATPLTDAVALQGLDLLCRYLPTAYQNAGDLSARAWVQVGAFLGGLALVAGMVLGHSMAYTLANRLRVAHGLSCAVALPYCMAYNLRAAADRLAAIARVMGAGLEPQAAVLAIHRLNASLGISESQQWVGLARKDLAALVEECITIYPRPNNPRALEPGPLLRLYEAAWAGAEAPEV
jgi:alcohol dehydrogenase class IV